MRRPQPTVPYVGDEEPVVDRVEISARAAGVPEVVDADRKGRRQDGDRDVRRNGGRAARIADPAQDQPPEGGVARADDVALGRGRVVVVHAARSVRSVRADETAKRGRHERAAAQRGALPDDVGVEVHERARRRVEHVSADVQRVDVDAERRVVEELARISASDRVLLDEIERPDRAARESHGAGRVRDGEEQAIRNVPDAQGRGARDVDDGQEPASRQPVVAHLRIAREIEPGRSLTGS